MRRFLLGRMGEKAGGAGAWLFRRVQNRFRLLASGYWDPIASLTV